jgi:NifU-like protein
MAWDYSEKTKELFMDAVQGKAGTHLGEIEDADGTGEHGSLACGDAMRFTFRVDRHATDPVKDVIVEAKYLTFGCTSAIAASEALCAIIEAGKYTPITALEITNNDIVRYLGGLPAQKMHCSVMGAEALEAAVYNWAQKRGVDLDALGIEFPTHIEQEGRVVCKCFTLTEPYLKRKIRELELKTIDDITNAVKAGGGCMSCHHAPGGLQDLLCEVWGPEVSPNLLKVVNEPEELKVVPEPGPALSPYRFAKDVEKTVDEAIRPLLQADGGDIEIVDIKDKLIYVRLEGACDGCPGATSTLKRMVEQTLKDKVDGSIRIISL